MEGQVKYTNASEWKKKEQTDPLELPSGAIVEVKRASVPPLLMANIMAMTLLSSSDGKEAVEKEGLSADQAMAVSKGYGSISRIVQSTVVSPRIIFDEVEIKDGEISAYEIPSEDLNFLMSYCLKTEEAKKLESFRPVRSSADAGSNEQEIRTTPVHNGRVV